MPPSDHDSPWKEALEGWFPEFLALLFPAVHAGIDQDALWGCSIDFRFPVAKLLDWSCCASSTG